MLFTARLIQNVIKIWIFNIRALWFGWNANNLKYWWKQTLKDIAITYNRLHFNQWSLCCCWKELKERKKWKEKSERVQKNGYNFWYGRKSRWKIHIHIPVNLQYRMNFSNWLSSTCLFSLFKRESSTNLMLISIFSSIVVVVVFDMLVGFHFISFTLYSLSSFVRRLWLAQ